MLFFKKKTVADMHTHSEHSHDSVCPIEDMVLAQIEKGTGIFAVTNHCDVYSYNDYDIFTPLKKAWEEVQELNKKYKGKCLLLSGVEVSEGFWFLKEYQKALSLCKYDVVIGSVHCVLYKDLTCAYSKIDFSKMPDEEIYAYLDAYFNDVLTMLSFRDIDVLAHLDCPLRYIKAKFKKDIDMTRFDGKIEQILRFVINQKIAFEVNTSSYKLLSDTMPSKRILQKYYNMGGRMLTLGSDAHSVEGASVDFDKVLLILKEIGFKKLYYFKNRKKKFYKI